MGVYPVHTLSGSSILTCFPNETEIKKKKKKKRRRWRQRIKKNEKKKRKKKNEGIETLEHTTWNVGCLPAWFIS
jgi:hypothetical protein